MTVPENKPPVVPDTAILASAGSGKTFQLTNRFISLLALGVPPERVVALTFTRLAAGEIFDKTVSRLCEAAASSDNSEALNRALKDEDGSTAGLPLQLTQHRVVGMLRGLLMSMHVCSIGTIDSFLVRILRAFPHEFGMTGTFDIIDEHTVQLARRHVLQRVLGHGDEDDRRAFRESFKRATFGREEKRFQDLLDAYVEDSHGTYLEAPDGRLWAASAAIWPEGHPWFACPDDERRRHAEALRADFLPGVPEKSRPAIAAFIDAAEQFTPGQTLNRSAAYAFAKLTAALPELEGGRFDYTKTVAFDGKDCEHVLALVRHVGWCEIEGRLEDTRGIYEILHTYEQYYRRLVRQAGKLQFDDVSFLLAHPELAGPAAGRAPVRPDHRLAIDYRLDGQFDHWLFDEFQDTSSLQWSAVRNLVDEVVQDAEGRRTAFFVGDVKQAIYGWRGGDPELFDWVLDTYRERIRRGHLAKSWRSASPVIDAVNRVFDSLTEANPNLPPAVLERWRQQWQTHETARDDLKGYAVALQLEKQKGSDSANRDRRTAATVELIRQVDPVGRGLRAAVVVRHRDAGQEIMSRLRGEGIPAVMEGRYGISENALCSAFLSLFAVAEHGGDTFAWQHLRMTPFAVVVDRKGMTQEDVARSVLDTIWEDGFERVVEIWGRELGQEEALDDYGRRALEDLTLAAGAYDRTGGKSCSDFVAFVREYESRDVAHDDVVTVMTIHASKGLEFDMVVLPDLQSGNGITTWVPKGLQICRSEAIHRQPRWVLSMPKKDVACADPGLGAFWQEEAERSCYEELCNLYVGMTRARQALYIITTDSGRSSTVRLANVVENGLARDAGNPRGTAVQASDLPGTALFEAGDPQWFAACKPRDTERAGEAEREKTATPEPPPAMPEKSARRRVFKRKRPSDMETTVVDAGTLFSDTMRGAAEFGTAVHAGFEQIEWLETTDVRQLTTSWEPPDGRRPGLARDVRSVIKSVLESAEARTVFSRPPDENVELWRERRFEVILDDEWVTGTFDRVELHRKAQGNATGAVITDFKTSAIREEADRTAAVERYAPQLELYRRVLATLTGVPRSGIRAQLLFTDDGRVVEV